MNRSPCLQNIRAGTAIHLPACSCSPPANAGRIYAINKGLRSDSLAGEFVGCIDPQLMHGFVSATPGAYDACAVMRAAGKKKNVNVGNRGGTAGLDDYKFDQPLDDDYDFM